MAGDALAGVQDLDRIVGDARLNALADQAVRHAVVMAVDVDVVIDMHLGTLERGRLKDARRQRLQRRLIDGLEPAAPRPVELLERPLVEIGQSRADWCSSRDVRSSLFSCCNSLICLFSCWIPITSVDRGRCLATSLSSWITSSL